MTKLTEYFGTNWQGVLSANNLASFSDLWDLKVDWFEEPNIRRGGWSGVAKVYLKTSSGKVGVFLKRQENHFGKTLFHPIKGIPTFNREFKNILKLNQHNIPTPELVYFGQRKHHGNWQAILITQELAGYTSLDAEQFSNEKFKKDILHKNELLSVIADTLRHMHHHHFRHNCFHLKHIFVKPDGDSWDIKIIDFEKLKWSLFKQDTSLRDLYSLQQHATGWSTKDKVKLFKMYVQEKKLSKKPKALWKKIEKKVLSKTA